MKLTSFVLALALLCGNTAAAVFHKIDGTTISGELQAIAADGTITIKREDSESVKIAAEDLMRIQAAEDRESDEPIEGVVLHMPGGDRVFGSLTKSSQTDVEVRTASMGTVRFALDKLLAIEFRRAGELPKNADKMRAEMLHNTTGNDISYSVTGDQMAGILTGFESDKVLLKLALAPDEIPVATARLFGISFAARKRPPPPPSLLAVVCAEAEEAVRSGDYNIIILSDRATGPDRIPIPSLLAVVHCADASVVTGRLLESKGDALRLALVAGPEVEIAPSALIEITFKQGKLVYLSDLKPEKETYTPFFGGDPTWPFRPDQNYDRGPIRLGGKTYRKGLGTFSGMWLTYALGGEFRRFVALVGIDDADTNHQGNVTVRVLADGKEIFQRADLTRKSSPVRIDLSVEKAQTLELVVDFGKNMHFGDLTDWADAYLVR